MPSISILDKQFEPFISVTELQQKVSDMGANIAADYHGRSPLCIGILNGAFVFAADLARACPIDGQWAFVRLSSYQGLATTGQVSTVVGLDVSIEGRDVIIVEDIVDTGTTLFHFMEELRQQKPASLALAAMFVKREAMQYPLHIDYWGIEIPNRFVVGYGLDYDGYGRNLPDLYQLKI